MSFLWVAKRFILLLAVFSLLLFATGCKEDVRQELTGEARVAADYLEKRGYEILRYRTGGSRYTLTEEMLDKLPYQQIWAVQEVDAADYIGRELAEYGFIVGNHPLEERYAMIYAERDYDTYVTVMIFDGEVIGGTSFPVGKGDEALMGAPFGLDGEDANGNY